MDMMEEEGNDPSKAKGVAKHAKYDKFKIGRVEGYDVYKIPQGRKDLYGMSCDLGSGTEWCTATGKTRVHFNGYIEANDIFIFINDRGTKYQYSGDQFMDKNDNEINYGDDLFYSMIRFLLEERQIDSIPLKMKLVHYPDSLSEWERRIKGDLDLSHMSIRSLPQDFRVEGMLDISGTLIKEIPADLKVGDTLYCTRMARGVKVLGNSYDFSMDFSDSRMVDVSNLRYLDGDLEIPRTENVILPDADVHITGNLDLRSTGIEWLPMGLRVDIRLLLNDTAIESLPSDIIVAREVDISYTPLARNKRKDEIMDDINADSGFIGTLILGR